MVFAEDSQIVKNYLLLIHEGLRERGDVPNLFNLQEVVYKCLDEQGES